MLRGEERATKSPAVPTPDPAETAAYIGEITTELAKLARGSNLDLVAYLLDMVQLEAATAARPGKAVRRSTG